MSGTVVIRSADADHHLRHLTGWLRGEDQLRGRVAVIEKPLEPGELVGSLDSVVVIVTGGTASTLVNALFDWLGSHQDVDTVALSITKDGTGERLELECGPTGDATSVLAAVRELLG